jgi:hypothetical protein
MAQKEAIMRALMEAMGSSAPMTSKRPMARPKMIGGMPGGSTRGIDPKDNYSPEGLMRLLNQGMGESGKTISDADKARIRKMMMGRINKSPTGMMGGGKVMKYESGGAVEVKGKKKKPKMGCVMKGRGGKYKGRS